MGKHAEQIATIVDLMDELFSTENNYIHMDFVLQSGGTGVRYNIYTPVINHNNFDNFKDFHAFVMSLKANGNKKIRRKILNKMLGEQLNAKNNATERIREIYLELSILQD